MSQFIISKADLQRYEDIPNTIDDTRLRLYIQKAQHLDLKPFLGQALYWYLLKQFDTNGNLPDNAAQPYRNLFNGCSYTNASGHEITYEGLSPALVYWTMARFAETDAIRFTATGPMFKQQDNGTPVRLGDLDKIVESYRSIANAYANEAAAYLHCNREDFPLWNYNPKNANSRQPGPRLRGIDRTDFNQTGDYNTNYPLYNDFY